MSDEITYRLTELNRKLEVIGKIQRTQDNRLSRDCKAAVRTNGGSEIRCRCIRHALKEELHVLCEDGKMRSRVHCSLKTCKARGKICLCNRNEGKERKGDESDNSDERRLWNAATYIAQAENKQDQLSSSIVPYHSPTRDKVSSVNHQAHRSINAPMQAVTRDNADGNSEESGEIKLTDSPLKWEHVRELKEKLKTATLVVNKLKDEVISSQNQLSEFYTERDDLKLKLCDFIKNEGKRCTDVETELNRMKIAVNRKKRALETERNQLRGMIVELMNIVKIQKKRICNISHIYDKQRKTLHEKETMLVEKESENREIVRTCNETKDRIEKLKSCLKEQSRGCNRVIQKLERYHYNVKIKEKIIENQNEAIKKQKKLLAESENIAQQTAREFQQLRDEFYCEKRTCSSMQAELDSVQMQLADSVVCGNCAHLQDEIECLKRQRVQALNAVKFTVDKLRNANEEFSRELSSERRQQTFLMTVLCMKHKEMECLKREILQFGGSENIYKIRRKTCARDS